MAKSGEALVMMARTEASAAIFAYHDGERFAAQRWIEVSDELSKRKDAAMRKGAIRVADSTTTKIDEPTCRGFLQDKSMKAGSSKFEVASIDLQRGRIVVETVFSVEPLAKAEHIALVKQMLDAVKWRP